VKITKESLRGLPLDADKSNPDKTYWDDELTGFGVRFRLGKKPTYIVQYRAEGKSHKPKIGDVGVLELDEARRQAKKVLAAVTLGTDPGKEKAAARERAKVTLGAVADAYLDFKRGNVSASQLNADRRYFAQHWKPFRGLPLHAVSHRDLAAHLGALTKERGKYAASGARTALNALFTWSLKEGLIDSNPIIRTHDPNAGKRSRERVLSDTEIRSIWTAAGDNEFGIIIKLLLLTGARRSEIGGMRWSEIDFESGILTIPGTRTKNGRTLALTLPPLALDILEQAPHRGSREFVFAWRGREGFNGYSDGKALLDERIAKAEGNALAPWRIHDTRRSVATGMAEIGIQPHIIEACLNHISGHKGGVAGVYNRAAYSKEIKVALAQWADRVDSIVHNTERKVLSMRPAVS
jgi:integrase